MCYGASGQVARKGLAIEIDKIEATKRQIELSISLVNSSEEAFHYENFLPVMQFGLGYTKVALTEAIDSVNIDRSGFLLRNADGSELDPLNFFNIFFHRYESVKPLEGKQSKRENFVISASSQVEKCVKIKLNEVKLPPGQYSLKLFKYFSSSELLIESSWHPFIIPR